MITYEVPVWLKITADSCDDAFRKAVKVMRDAEQYDQLPDYVVEEPVMLLTGPEGWNKQDITPG